MTEGWYLVLMIWGEKYNDEDCNKLIRQALALSKNCKGAVVFTDRLDRRIDPRAILVSIPDDFSDPSMKAGGLPVKLAIFEIDEINKGETCVYVDLDSIIIGNLDPVSDLSRRAFLWTIPTFPRPFSRFSRFIWRVTNRSAYRYGNSSAFVYRNKYLNNPTCLFRRYFSAGALPEKLMHDDLFIGWSSQDVVRGLPTSLVVNFRYEFLFPKLWIGYLMAKFRRKSRKSIAIVTFAGPLTKPDFILSLSEGAEIVDHHKRIGIWDNKYTSTVKQRLIESSKF